MMKFIMEMVSPVKDCPVMTAFMHEGGKRAAMPTVPPWTKAASMPVAAVSKSVIANRVLPEIS